MRHVDLGARRLLRALMGLAGALGLQGPATAAAADLAPVEGEVIVQFKADAGTTRRYALAARAEAGTVRTALAARAATLGARVGRALEAGQAVGERTQVVRAAGVSAATLAAQLAADPDVEWAEPNGRKRRTAAPNDPLYAAAAAGVRPNGPDSGQWYLRAPAANISGGPVSSIDIERAWDRTRGSSSIVVAVLDTGVRADHPDLAGRLLPGYDMVSNITVANDGNGRDSDPSDPGDWVTVAESGTSTFNGCGDENSSWHGTTTTSLIAGAANDGQGMAGAAPGVRVLHVRVLGKCYGTDGDIQAGMRWAGGLFVPGVSEMNPNRNPAKVINMSLGGGVACTPAYQAVVNDLLAAGVVVVAAGGNGAGGAVGTPGNCTGVVAVAGLRHAGSKVGFSDLGTEIAIAAPGGNCINIARGSACLYPILGASNTGTRGPEASTWSDSFNATVGTSFASPLTAAVAALMFSAQPLLSVSEMRSRMQATARTFPTSGADNGTDPTPVTQCVAPRTGVEQLQCYCTTALCGAGMLDAGSAVAAAAGAVARITVDTASPTAGAAVVLNSATSLPGINANIVAWAWSITNNGGIATAFGSATNAASASLTPTGAGSLTVALTVTDSVGNSASSSQTVTVAAAPVAQPPSTGGGGGGAMSWPWLVLLALAAGLLRASHTPRQ